MHSATATSTRFIWDRMEPALLARDLSARWAFIRPGPSRPLAICASAVADRAGLIDERAIPPIWVGTGLGASTQAGTRSYWLSILDAATVMADSEKGCAGQVWRPCPKAVTNSTARRSTSPASRLRLQWSASHVSRPGAALLLVRGEGWRW